MLSPDVAGTTRRTLCLQNLLHRLLWIGRNVQVLMLLSAFLGLTILPACRPLLAATTHKKTHTVHSTKKRHVRKATHRRATKHRATRHQRTTRNSSRAREFHQAFVVSSELRPMARQLIQDRSPQAYAGVEHYARTHTGEASAAAYMALGAAHYADGKFKEAALAFQQANRHGKVLADYADYLGAKANFSDSKFVVAEQLLQDFDGRHPDSILIDRATLLLANVKLNEGDPQDALHQLARLEGSRLARSTEYLFILAKSDELAGYRQKAQELYTRVYLGDPTSAEAKQVPDQLHQMGINPIFTLDQRIQHAAALYDARQYGQAAAEYKALASDPAIVGTARMNDLLAWAALASFEQAGHVDPSQLASLSDTNKEAGAIRLYLRVEAARDNKDATQVKQRIAEIEQRFPTSRWTADALFSAGNMALLLHDLPTAIQYYGEFVSRFPRSSKAPLGLWHEAWLTYRMGDKKAAALLFDEQIKRYPDDSHASTAMYWRGVVYEEVEKNPAAAAACYQKLVNTYRQYYYSNLARERLSKLTGIVPAKLPLLAHIDPPATQTLTTQVPSDDVHLERARLLANSGLYQYIVPEISSSPGSSTWGPYAEAQLYSSDGETWRALRVMKQKVRSYFSVPISSIPKPYWELLFPRPYWPALQRNAQKQGLDPYLVVSLVRQESEFNPKVISYADARGLMQLLPRVGSKLARKEHLRGYHTASLMDPDVNLQLGTAYFKELMDEFHDEPAYALAAYNAGDNRVTAWLANGPYASLPEFVESIPFTETRMYVQAILRNREMYRLLYSAK